ncbi:MAG TPA: hypothetical protein VF721_16510 [Pyrinomonadaceae bacterium]|jgi:hypothetical protein
MTETNTTREFLRHTVATLAYRGGKAVKGAPDTFGAFKIGETTRTPLEILAHIGDLLEWALTMAKGNPVWKAGAPREWNEEVERFFDGLKNLDEYLASDAPLANTVEKLFQGPVADALQHVGQINLLRRLADAPIRGENYFRAEIERGRVGAEQSDKRLEFD